MSEQQRVGDDPDVSYKPPIDSDARIRTERGINQGNVVWFLVQLEVNLQPAWDLEDDWRPAARFDHHPDADWGHDIREERLHLDIMNPDGGKQEVKRGFPVVSVNEAPAYCETFLRERADDLRRGF